MSQPVSWKSPSTRQASRMATISACAVGSLDRVTWLAPVAMTIPSFTTNAAKGPPSRRTFSTASSMACCMNELVIRLSSAACLSIAYTIIADAVQPGGYAGRLCFNQPGANGIPDHAGGFMDAELFKDAATVRVGGLVADSQLRGGFLGGPACRDQHQNL